MIRSLLFLLITIGTNLLSQNISIKQKTQIPIQKKTPQKTSPQRNVLNDSDGDGISDAIDKCPFVKGTIKNEGCPFLQNENVSSSSSNVTKIIKNPFFSHRDSKLVTINSVEVNAKQTVIEFEYMCSYKYENTGFFQINPETYLETGSKNYKLLFSEGIAITPKETKCSNPGVIYKFKLFFERLDDTVSEFNVIECPDKNTCFNFYYVNITESNSDPIDGVEYSTKIKNDLFVSYLDPLSIELLEDQIFVHINSDYNDIFDSIISSFKSNKKFLKDNYDKIEKYTFDKKNAYSLVLKKGSSLELVEFYISKDKNKSDRISLIKLYLDEEYKIEKFFKSFCEFYGYAYKYNSEKREGIKIFSYPSLDKKFYSSIIVKDKCIFINVSEYKSPNEKEQLLIRINKQLEGFITVSDNMLNNYDDIKKLDLLNDFALDESFPAGYYEIPSNIKEFVSKGYDELVDKIIDKYNSKNTKPLVLHISIYGYTDEIEAERNPQIRNEIINEFGLPFNVKNSVINEKISYKKAQVISKILQEKLNNNSKIENLENLKIDIREIGRGEEFPFPNINYSKDDKRRRIVRIQWCLIPQKYYN
jgi:hypothetical protein